MTPSAVKAYLADRQRATLRDIAIHFDSSPDAVRQVVRQWQDKGRVRRIEAGGGCAAKSCGCSCGCASQEQEVYEWLG